MSWIRPDSYPSYSEALFRSRNERLTTQRWRATTAAAAEPTHASVSAAAPTLGHTSSSAEVSSRAKPAAMAHRAISVEQRLLATRVRGPNLGLTPGRSARPQRAAATGATFHIRPQIDVRLLPASARPNQHSRPSSGLPAATVKTLVTSWESALEAARKVELAPVAEQIPAALAMLPMPELKPTASEDPAQKMLMTRNWWRTNPVTAGIVVTDEQIE